MCRIIALVCTFVVVAQACRADAVQNRAEADDPAGRTILRLARSSDGLTFEAEPRVFAMDGAAPDLTVLPNGDLLALYDAEMGDGPEAQSRIVAVRSRDGGRTWSTARPIEIRDSSGKRIRGAHADLTEVADRQYRLFFAVGADQAERREAAAENASRKSEADRQHDDVPVQIRSAVTPDGLRYLADDEAEIRMVARGDLHPMAVRVGKKVWLLAEDHRPRTETGGGSQRLWWLTSNDGRDFERKPNGEAEGISFVGSLVPIERGVRAYVSDAEGVRSMVSRDGREWQAEPGVRVAGGFDPAVARLSDGTWLMVCCVALDAKQNRSRDDRDSDTADSVNDRGRDGAYHGAEEDWDTNGPIEDPELVALGVAGVDAAEGAAWDDELDAPLVGPVDGRVTDGSTDGLAAADGQDTDEWDLDEFDAQILDELAWSDESQWGGHPALDLAPLPDLETVFDYYTWWERNNLIDVPDNAFDAYANLIPMPGGSEAWPEFHNMFTDRDRQNGPAPWDPADHSEWEASANQALDLLDRFWDAGQATSYALRPMFSEEPQFPLLDGQPLLINMLLPNLGAHRDLVKAALAEAWRIDENGNVSQEGMLDAFESSMRNAKHVAQGPTLIESLVSCAEHRLVHESALAALEHDVFDEAGMEEALHLLRELDSEDIDPARWTRAEHAAAQQCVQYLFHPDAPDGPDERVLEAMANLFADGEEARRSFERVKSMERSDALEAAGALDDYYRELTPQWRSGYPAFRMEDMNGLADQYRDTNALTELLLPSLGRAAQVQARTEASRRATQLTYAAHLFRERNGRWPASLDELPAEFGRRMRIDPFSGGSFGYRLTGDGPVIYSAGENGVDDGGVHADRWGDGQTQGAESDDYVFWPPQR